MLDRASAETLKYKITSMRLNEYLIINYNSRLQFILSFFSIFILLQKVLMVELQVQQYLILDMSDNSEEQYREDNQQKDLSVYSYADTDVQKQFQGIIEQIHDSSSIDDESNHQELREQNQSEERKFKKNYSKPSYGNLVTNKPNPRVASGIFLYGNDLAEQYQNEQKHKMRKSNDDQYLIYHHSRQINEAIMPQNQEGKNLQSFNKANTEDKYWQAQHKLLSQELSKFKQNYDLTKTERDNLFDQLNIIKEQNQNYKKQLDEIIQYKEKNSKQIEISNEKYLILQNEIKNQKREISHLKEKIIRKQDQIISLKEKNTAEIQSLKKAQRSKQNNNISPLKKLINNMKSQKNSVQLQNQKYKKINSEMGVEIQNLSKIKSAQLIQIQFLHGNIQKLQKQKLKYEEQIKNMKIQIDQYLQAQNKYKEMIYQALKKYTNPINQEEIQAYQGNINKLKQLIQIQKNRAQDQINLKNHQIQNLKEQKRSMIQEHEYQINDLRYQIQKWQNKHIEIRKNSQELMKNYAKRLSQEIQKIDSYHNLEKIQMEKIINSLSSQLNQLKAQFQEIQIQKLKIYRFNELARQQILESDLRYNLLENENNNKIKILSESLLERQGIIKMLQQKSNILQKSNESLLQKLDFNLLNSQKKYDIQQQNWRDILVNKKIQVKEFLHKGQIALLERDIQNLTNKTRQETLKFEKKYKMINQTLDQQIRKNKQVNQLWQKQCKHKKQLQISQKKLIVQSGQIKREIQRLKDEIKKNEQTSEKKLNEFDNLLYSLRSNRSGTLLNSLQKHLGQIQKNKQNNSLLQVLEIIGEREARYIQEIQTLKSENLRHQKSTQNKNQSNEEGKEKYKLIVKDFKVKQQKNPRVYQLERQITQIQKRSRQELQMKKRNYEQLQGKVAKITRESTNLKIQNENLKRDLLNKDTGANNIIRQFQQEKNKRTRLSQQLENLKRQMQAAKKSQDIKVGSLIGSREKKLQEEVKHLKKQLQTVKSQREQVKIERDQIKRQSNAIRNQKASNQKEREERQKYLIERREFQENIRKLEQKYSELRNINLMLSEQAKNSNEKGKSRYEENESRSMRQNENNVAEIRRLNKLISENQEVVKALTENDQIKDEKIRKLEFQLNKINSQIGSSNPKNTISKSEKQEFQREIIALQESLESKNNEIYILQEENTRLKQKYNEQTKKMQSQYHTIKKKNQAYKKLLAARSDSMEDRSSSREEFQAVAVKAETTSLKEEIRILTPQKSQQEIKPDFSNHLEKLSQEVSSLRGQNIYFESLGDVYRFIERDTSANLSKALIVSPFLEDEEYESRNFLLKSINEIVEKKLERSKFVYRMDETNKNFGGYINKSNQLQTESFLFLFRTKRHSFGCCSLAKNVKGRPTAFLFSLTNRKVVFKRQVAVDSLLPVKYSEFNLMIGVNQIRIRSGSRELIVAANTTAANRYFEQFSKVQILGEESVKYEILDFQIHKLYF